MNSSKITLLLTKKKYSNNNIVTYINTINNNFDIFI